MKIKKKINKKVSKKAEGGFGESQDWGNAYKSNAGINYGKNLGTALMGAAPNIIATAGNQNISTADKVANIANTTGDTAASAIPGFGQFYGAARGITSGIQNALPGTDKVDIKTGRTVNVKKSNAANAFDQWLTPDHTHASNSWALAAASDNPGDKAKYAMMGIGDLFGITKIARTAQAGLGKDPEGRKLVDKNLLPNKQENLNFPTVNPNMPENTPIMAHGGQASNKSSQNHLLEKYKLLPHSQLNPNLANAHMDGKPVQLEKNETVFKMANGGSFAFSPNMKDKDGVTYADKSRMLEKIHSKPYYDSASENTLKYNLQKLADENQAKITKKEQAKVVKAADGIHASEIGADSFNNDRVARNWMWDKVIQNQDSYAPYGYKPTTNIGFNDRQGINTNIETFKPDNLNISVDNGNFNRVEGPNTKQLRNSINWDNKPTNIQNDLTTGDYLQLAGQLPALAYNTGMAFRKPEKQKLYQDLSPITPNQQGIDLNPMYLAQNTAFKTINEATSSDAVRRANLANITSGTQRNMADALLQNKNLNASLRGQFEQRLADRSRFNIAQKLGVDDINAKNRAAQRMFGATAATNLGQGLTNFGLAKNQGLSNTIQYSTLQQLAANYGLDPDSLADLYKAQGKVVLGYKKSKK